jgi:hypothetical protein
MVKNILSLPAGVASWERNPVTAIWLFRCLIDIPSSEMLKRNASVHLRIPV